MGETGRDLIAIQDVRKSFGHAEAVRGVSLSVPEGALAVIIGPSGCGKSTLLRCLNGLELLDAGRVRVGDVTLEKDNGRFPGDLKARLRRLREELGMVFQSFNLFPHLTALENAALAPIVVKGIPREEARGKARALLAKVGLGDRLDYYPGQLSGGQQQRAAIARALAMSPRAVLYDEPTSSLDPTLVNEVLGIMRQLHDEGMTQVVVTHEMRFARDVADTIHVMHEGRLIESGPPAELFTAPRDPRTREFLKSFL
ncbi:MAG TPA: amino acid ABC transporter ATP-binding protein [Candidatus Binatia bacterium]|nr:amino acid ABC transporter ATP-binding protein [Candidatus Binatia bacterium]